MKNSLMIFLLVCFSQFALADECKFSSSPVVISQLPHEMHLFWQESDDAVFTSNEIPRSPALLNYLAQIKRNIADTNAFSLLQKEYDDFTNSGSAQLMSEAPNMWLALNGKVGALRTANCLDLLLLNQQVGRGLAWDTPMEFSIFILKNVQSSRPLLKIYYSTNDRPGGKIDSEVIRLIQGDLSNGWLLANHRHNHTFNTPVSDGIILVGAPSPSLSDVDLYRELQNNMGLESASVTNGFTTFDIDHGEFNILHAH